MFCFVKEFYKIIVFIIFFIVEHLYSLSLGRSPILAKKPTHSFKKTRKQFFVFKSPAKFSEEYNKEAQKMRPKYFPQPTKQPLIEGLKLN
jgi:hypothetical protein